MHINFQLKKSNNKSDHSIGARIFTFNNDMSSNESICFTCVNMSYESLYVGMHVHMCHMYGDMFILVHYLIIK